jgi:hypothetical protein
MPRQPPPDRRHLLLIPLAALFVVHPLIVHGCSCGHDFDFHLLNWFEASIQLAHGNLHPHWAFTPAFNAGEPRFVFYPPISWYLGALLGLVLTHLPGVSESTAWSAAPILFTWIALTLSGLTMHRLARAFASPSAALFAAVVYLANPYMLFTAYERTAYAELLAAAWLPLLLLAILRQRVTIPGIALPLALLWLTNAPAAVMGTYTLALLAALRLFTATNPGAPEPALSLSKGLASETWDSRHGTRLRLALTTLTATALGFALAAFYILPAAYERRFVQVSMATIDGMRIDHNFLFAHTGTTPDNLLHDQVLHTASVIAVLLLAATALALPVVRLAPNPSYPSTTPGAPSSARLSRLRWASRASATPATEPGAPRVASETWESRHNPFPLLPLAILTALVALLLTPLSAPIWAHAPEAAFLQFPWRLLAILAPILCLTLARALTPTPFGRQERADQSPGAPSIPATGVPGERSLLAGVARWVGRNALALLAITSLIALTLPAYHLFRQPCDPEDTAPARLALFHSNLGNDPTDEYTPTTADNDALQPNNPPYSLADSPTAAPTTNAGAPHLDSEMWEVPPPTPGPAPTHLTLTTPHPATLILNLRDYPAWRITLNGAPAPPRLPRPDGLIAIPIPSGPSTLDIRYAHSLDQTLGDAFTLLALPILLLTLRRRRMNELSS